MIGKVITGTNAIQKVLDVSNWVDKSREFQNRSMESLLQHNAIKLYSTHNKQELVFTKRFKGTIRYQKDLYQ